MLSISLIKFIQALSYFVDSKAGTNKEKVDTLNKLTEVTKLTVVTAPLTPFVSYYYFKYKERKIIDQMYRLNLVHIENNKVFRTDLGDKILTVLLEIE